MRGLYKTLGILTLSSSLLLACRSEAGAPEPSSEQPQLATQPMTRAGGTAYEAAAKISLAATAPEEHPALHNVFELSDNIISGSEPDGEEAFRILHEKGVRTILSVDGKVPDAKLAAKYGMKYVHVPIQYKGITDDEVAKITKTFRELEGPFYVHCFHGKHRGPAAAELGRLVLDGISREEAIGEMRQWLGTSANYEGLYSTVAYVSIPTERETHNLAWDFPAAAPLDGVAGAMVFVSRAHDHLKAAFKHDWQPDPMHPDVSAHNEAEKLVDHLERTAALSEVQEQAEDFRQWMVDSQRQALELSEVLGEMSSGGGSVDDANRAFEGLTQSCKSCHNVYRN